MRTSSLGLSEGGVHVRAKEPVSNWEPEDEEDEELIWERLRAQRAEPGTSRERATSEVVPRTRVAGEHRAGADPYAAYANQVQSTSQTPPYGVASVQAAYDAADGIHGELQDELQEDEDEEDEEALWERLRSGNAPDQRVSDIGALGAHQAYRQDEEAEEH
jgi:hypothetical protein